MRSHRTKGLLAEVEFLKRLLQHGYTEIFRPVLDSGVDFLVHTTKGWQAVQVKSGRIVRVKNRNRPGLTYYAKGHRSEYEYRSVDLSRGHHAAARHESSGSLEHYRQAGVTVFAALVGDAFYLIPLEEMSGDVTTLQSLHWTREAWDLVLGEPITPPEPAKESSDPLEQMWLLPVPE